MNDMMQLYTSDNNAYQTMHYVQYSWNQPKFTHSVKVVYYKLGKMRVGSYPQENTQQE